jgi:hypothetical protein
LGVLLILLGFAPSLLPALVLFFCLGAANIVFLVPNITISQEATPRSSVLAWLVRGWPCSTFPGCRCSPSAGALADHVDAGVLIAIAGAMTLTTAVIGAFAPTVRDVA